LDFLDGTTELEAAADGFGQPANPAPTTSTLGFFEPGPPKAAAGGIRAAPAPSAISTNRRRVIPAGEAPVARATRAMLVALIEKGVVAQSSVATSRSCNNP
jgi:hypothetical protein